MTEERKFAILFAATILAVRKLIEIDPHRPNMAKGFFVDRAIEDAAFILERIDARWPTTVNSFSAKRNGSARSQQVDFSEEFVVMGISLLNVDGLLSGLARKCTRQCHGGVVTSCTVRFLRIVSDVFLNDSRDLNSGHSTGHADHPVLFGDT